MDNKIKSGIILLLIMVIVAVPVIAKPRFTPPGLAKSDDTKGPAETATGSTEETEIAGTAEEPTATETSDTSSDETTAEETEKESTNWEMVGAIVGILAVIGGLVGWLISRKKRSKSSNYLKNINETFNEYKSDTSKCEANLYLLKEKIEKDFTDGKIDEQSLQLLHGRIEKYLKNVRLGIVDGLDVSPDAKKELTKMLKDGKISEKEYDEFTKNRSLSEKDKSLLSKHMTKWKKKDK